MSEPKSKFPDFEELGAMAGKFYKDMKSSVEGIIEEYKKKHADTQTTATEVHKEPATKSATAAPKKPTEKKAVKKD